MAIGTAAFAAVPNDPQQLLKHADSIKSANNAEFAQLLKQLQTDSPRLSASQQLHLNYLEAWQTAYEGHYADAVLKLNAVIDHTRDVTLRFRAHATIINVLAIASRNEEAYKHLNQMIDILPEVSDAEARQQGLLVASFLYSEAGQYDLGLEYANKVLAGHYSERGECQAGQLKVDALFKSGNLLAFDREYQNSITNCEKSNELIFANLVRSDVAMEEIAQKKYRDAIRSLTAHYAEVQSTHYARLTSEVDSILSRAYWSVDDIGRAKQYANSAVDKSVKKEITRPLVDAYSILYLTAKKQGDFQSALAYHEKYSAAERGYLNDTSARALAYQMVNQQVQAKKREVEALSQKNQLLQLQQRVDAKNAETERLYILLLISVLAFIVLWAYKTKRSQLRFMTLARRDSLTGIANRQHFLDSAEAALKYCGKSSREACLVIIDLDHFKQVNDAHGHAAGDRVLKQVVDACAAHLRSIDVFGRLGGEEFGILLPDCPIDAAGQRGEILRKAIAELGHSMPDIDPGVSGSFGIATTRTCGYDLRQLLIDADVALYRAKRGGRNRVAVQPANVAADSA